MTIRNRPGGDGEEACSAAASFPSAAASPPPKFWRQIIHKRDGRPPISASRASAASTSALGAAAAARGSSGTRTDSTERWGVLSHVRERLRRNADVVSQLRATSGHGGCAASSC